MTCCYRIKWKSLRLVNISFRLGQSCHLHLLAWSSSFSASFFWKLKPLKRMSLSMDSTSAIFRASSLSSITLVSFCAVRFICSIISEQMQKCCQLNVRKWVNVMRLKKWFITLVPCTFPMMALMNPSRSCALVCVELVLSSKTLPFFCVTKA